MKSPSYVIFIAALCCTGNCFQSKADNYPDQIKWEKINIAFVEFIRNPSLESAKIFSGNLPGDRVLGGNGSRGEILEYIFNEARYRCLEDEMSKGNKYAVEAAYRLLNLTDASYTVILLQTIGDLAKKRPSLFLEILDEYKYSQSIKLLGLPVTETGYLSEPTKIVAELELRRKALEGEKSERYSEIREECLRLLRLSIKYWLDYKIGDCRAA